MSILTSLTNVKAFVSSRHEVRLYNPKQLATHKQWLRDLEEAKAIIKQVEYYGGINTLLEQAAITAKSQSLFTDELSGSSNS